MLTSNLAGQRTSIVRRSNEALYDLLDADGRVYKTGVSAKVLAALAFAEGAFEVRHAYDLSLEERPPDVKR